MSYFVEFVIVSTVFAIAGFGAGMFFHNKIVRWFNKMKAALKEKL